MSRIIELLSYPFQVLFAAPLAWLSAFRALRAASLAMQAAILAFVVLAVLTIVATVLAALRPHHADWDVIFWNYTLRAACLAILIPPIVFVAVRLWTEGPASRHPDIDRAWQDGVAALAREGLSLAECPVFLVLGLRSERQVRRFMTAAQAKDLQYAVKGAPEGGSNPLFFYAIRDYRDSKNEPWNIVYVVLIDASQTSRLVARALDAGSQKPPLPDRDDTVRTHEIRGTLERQAPAPVGSVVGTIRDDGMSSGQTDDETPRAIAVDALRGTMQGVGGPGIVSTLVDVPGGGEQRHPAEVLDKSEQHRQSDRLGYVCRLLERAREPYCTLNGVLVVTPFNLLHRSVDQVRHLATATRQDVRTIQRSARLRCPVISLIGGMEHEAGFGELVRRVGERAASQQRIGSRFDPWNPATRERMEALAVHACDRIEGNVYDLFKTQDGFNKPGNGKLYNLVCRTRTGFAELLKVYLAGAFAETEERPMLFAGCYFAATGELERLNGFLKSVLADRMLENQDDLQWTDEALQTDQFLNTCSRACNLASGVVITGGLVWASGMAPWLWNVIRGTR